ncbi:hypothetical protein DYB32_001093 [Aphanomyces invadans]|uniref:RyR/IP3R Homology associated domain-containing protein n=1 Tax=Aphanomyces invadans TaxID=157072 RepID=A0A3R6ZW45_9STRA|nr:hypothetical protein DYB32_001093 [Aphanomyces invadans]
MQKQLSSNVGRTLHIGDLIYLNIDDGLVLGCDGFIHTVLRPSKPSNEWEDFIFCIHPKLSYDHVDMSVAVHPYFQTIDAFSEEERWRRNEGKLQEALESRDIVNENTTIQLFHIKSQQYLRVNPMIAASKANFHDGKANIDNDIVTNSPLILVSASVISAAQAVRKPKPVLLLDNHVKATVQVGLYTTHDPMVLQPFVWKNGGNAISGAGTRQVPLPRSYGLDFKRQASKVNSVFHLEMCSKSTTGEVLYQLRHVASRFLLSISCPCVKKDHITATLVNPEAVESVAQVHVEHRFTSPQVGSGTNDIREYEFQFSHTCPKCSKEWFLGATQHKVTFFKAMRVLVVGNDLNEVYLHEQFGDRLGQIKILTGLDIKFATAYVDARIIMTNMIAKNSGAVSHLLDKINAEHIVPGNWTTTAQFFIALSLAERKDALISKKLNDHEISITDMWVAKWDTCAIQTLLYGDNIRVRWYDVQSQDTLNILNRNGVVGLVPETVVRKEPYHVTLPLDCILDGSLRGQSTPLVDEWIALYVHQLKLVSALCEKNIKVRRHFQPKFPKGVLFGGILSMKLPFEIRTLYLELLHYLYLPATSMLENVQLSNLFLDLKINRENPLEEEMPALYTLLDMTLHDVVENNVAYFGFLREMLNFVDRVIMLGYCGTNPEGYKNLFESLYATGMKCDGVVKFESSADRLTLNPLNLSWNTVYGVANVVVCQRKLVALMRKVLRCRAAMSNDTIVIGKEIVQYLSSLLVHNDTLVAQEAFVTLSEVLPTPNFSWLRDGKPLCQVYQGGEFNDALCQIIHEAHVVFDLNEHTYHGHVERLHMNIKDEGRKTNKRSSRDPLQVAIQRVKKWTRNVVSNSTLKRLLRIAQIPERTIAYLEEALARGAFVVPSNDELALELEYYKKFLINKDNFDNITKGNLHFRVIKEQAVKDRAALAHDLLSLLQNFTAHLTEEYSLRLLVLVVPLVNDNYTLVKDVAYLVLKMLRQPNAVVDNRYSDVFQALLKHAHYNEPAGECVLHMLRESQSETWKNEASYHLFYSDFDLKSLLIGYPKELYVFDLLCLVADGTTNERIYGHLECKSLLSLKWIVQLITDPQATPKHHRVGLALAKTLYLDSDLETGWVSTQLDTLRQALDFCRNMLLTTDNYDVVVHGVVPFLKAWIAVDNIHTKNPIVVDFHKSLVSDMKVILDRLDVLSDLHLFTCANVAYPLVHVVQSLTQLTVCASKALVSNTRNDIARAYGWPMKKSPPQNCCYIPFVQGARSLLVSHASSQLLENPHLLKDRLVEGAFQRLQATSIPNATLQDLMIVGKHLLKLEQEATQCDQDLISLILAHNEISNSKTKKHSQPSRWATVSPQLTRLKAALAFRPSIARDKTFRGKTYQSLDVPMQTHVSVVVDKVNNSSSADTYAHWKNSYEPLDPQTLMQCLVRLITRSSSSSLLGLRVFIQALTSKRLAGEDTHTEDEKALLQARLEWKQLLSTAVKSDVTSLVFWCIKESMEEVSNPVKSRLALNLISELLVDGFEEAQDALYAGYVALDDNFRSYLFGFLMSHINGPSHEASIVSLTLFQLLCEGHHTNWQNIMRSSRFNRSVLDTVINLMSRICKQSDNIFSLKDVKVITKVLCFLSEACQGPCLENQQFLAESVVPRLCADIALGKPQCENGQYPLQVAKLKHNVNILLLSMVEGRDDSLVHLHYVELIPPQEMCRVLSANRKKIKVRNDLQADKNYTLANVVFAESIELLRLAYSLLSKVTNTVDPLYYFGKGWNEALNENVAFFAKQVINVEVVRGDTEIQVYFPRPRESRFLSLREKKRLMDIMEFGEDNALAAFTSAESR